METPKTLTFKYDNSYIILEMYDTTPFEDKRVISAIELAQDYPQASVELLKQANYPNGFIVGGFLKTSADDNTQSFLDTLKAIGIDLMVEVK